MAGSEAKGHQVFVLFLASSCGFPACFKLELAIWYASSNQMSQTRSTTRFSFRDSVMHRFVAFWASAN